MKKYLLILLLFLPLKTNLLFSQYGSALQVMKDVSILATREASNKVLYADVEGIPYYNENFTNGTVYLNNGDYGNVPLRYDLFQDQMEFKNEEKILWLTKADIKSVQYGKEILYVLPDFDDASKLTYYFMPDTGKCRLYIKRKIAFREMVPPKGYSDLIPDRFEREKDAFYLQFGSSPVQKIRNKKVLLTMLVNNRQALEFIKKEKIQADDAEDLTKLVGFLNKQ